MDDLFGILITIALAGLAFSNKNKKKSGRKERAEKTARRPANQAKIPFTKEEWAAYMKEQAQRDAQTPVPKTRKAPAAPKPEPALHLEHDEPEGTVSTQGVHSTQGESAAEHARHREKVLAEEQAKREQHESLQELRRLNTQKLRSAVVMSEVLGKPVSLRPRGYR